MGRITLSKTALNEARQALKRYRQCVPALEMKRQQLMQQLSHLDTEHAQKTSELLQIDEWVKEHLPDQVWSHVDASALIRIETFTLRQSSVLGVKMPVIDSLTLKANDFETLGSPMWLETLQLKLIEGLRCKLELRVLERQKECVQLALKTTSQRLNLFEKIRIPETISRIRKIEIALSDQERAAVVIAKIAKQKQQRAHQALQGGGL